MDEREPGLTISREVTMTDGRGEEGFPLAVADGSQKISRKRGRRRMMNVIRR